MSDDLRKAIQAHAADLKRSRAWYEKMIERKQETIKNAMDGEKHYRERLAVIDASLDELRRQYLAIGPAAESTD